MSEFISSVAIWLADVHVLAGALLAGALALMFALRQPARRMAVAKATLAALGALAVLSALPGWSVVHLLRAKPQAATASVDGLPENAAPAAFEYLPEENVAPFPVAADPPAEADSPTDEPLAAAIDWRAALLAAHGVGSAAVLVWLGLGAALARRTRRASRAAPAELVGALRAVVGGECVPELLVSDAVGTPVALGWRRPAIILPSAEGNVASILSHEWAHVANGDLRTLAASRVLLVLLWPQPLFWLLRQVVRLDQETLADAAAAERAGRADYAQQLVAWAREAGPRRRAPRLAGAVGLWEGPSQLKRRVAALLDEKLTVVRECSRRWKVGSALAALVAAGLLSLATLERRQAAAQDAAADATADVADDAAVDNDAEAAADSTATTEESADATREIPAWARYEPNVVKGRAVDEAGQPLAGVEVTLHRYQMGTGDAGIEQIAAQTTDDEGLFRFVDAVDVAAVFPRGLPDERFPVQPMPVIAVVGRTPSRAPSWGNDMAAAVVTRGHVHQLTMQPAATLRGRVTDAEGQPVSGAKVTAEFASLPGLDLYSDTTDAEGRYVIDDLAEFDAAEAKREYDEMMAAAGRGEASAAAYYYASAARPMLVQHPDFATRRVSIEAIPGEQDVQLQPGAVIEGVAMLRGPDGAERDAADATIQITRESPERLQGDPWSYQMTNVQTDAQGRYRASSLPAGRYTLFARTEGWVTLGVQGVEAVVGQTVEAPAIALTRGGTVRIKLVDAGSGEPMELPDGTRAWVNPQRRPPLPLGVFALLPNVATFDGGSAEIQLAEGDWVILVNIPGASPGEPYWQSFNFETVQTAEAHAVVEGEVSELILPMKKMTQPVTATATIQLAPIATLPEDDAEEDVDAPDATNDFVPAVEPADGEEPGAADDEGAGTERKPEHFVRIVVGPDSVTFEGEETTWEALYDQLGTLERRQTTVLEIALSSDEMSLRQAQEAQNQVGALARQYGFMYGSYVGVHPLGSRGSED